MRWLTIALCALLLAGCEQAIECGEGTELSAGMCVLAEPIPLAPCGPHTVLDDDTEQCVPEFGSATCPEFSVCERNGDGVLECHCGGDVTLECR